MKKLTLNALLITITIVLFTSCVSTKKGCGLTSDAHKIEQSATSEATVLAEV
ncbi:MAG: hypothetical protein HKP59_01090 [Lutibacter sp.]|jgi:hypothetical protein|uniref:hypothetical protein n=1 Tax=Lutibacter sp. TaxID=1925666 RepID=UPI00182B0032|nr:hypothetical protein [Lutibacter sp.]MBT8316201.1 hypothetical protein [Lutibacter sp.]NNJ57061.1 hypothetical protein [Lutibacter sp.]